MEQNRNESKERWDNNRENHKTTRVDIEVKTLVKQKTKSHFKHKKIRLITSYHPPSNYKDEKTLKYNEQVISITDNVPKTNIIIIGSDLNATIGNRCSNLNEPNPEERIVETSLLGPHGNPSRNKKDEELLNMLKQIQYRAISTFNGKHHNTWMHLAMKQHYQLDHFVMPKNQLRYVKNAKRKCNSIPSDHAAIYLELCLPILVHRPKKKMGEE